MGRSLTLKGPSAHSARQAVISSWGAADFNLL